MLPWKPKASTSPWRPKALTFDTALQLTSLKKALNVTNLLWWSVFTNKSSLRWLISAAALLFLTFTRSQTRKQVTSFTLTLPLLLLANHQHGEVGLLHSDWMLACSSMIGRWSPLAFMGTGPRWL